MAKRKAGFTVNARRFDPYKTFRFKVAVGALVSAIAGVLMLKKLLPRGSQRVAKDYQTPIPSNEPGRPINSVGTSTARRARAAPKAAAAGKTASTRRRKGAGTKGSRRKPR